ncbi:MAG: hypothetical protein ABI847_08405 [Anaerolineales bacterium]
MKPIFSNRLADALAKTVLCSGVVHLALLAGLALRGQIEVLNAFNIVQLDLWFPSLHSGLFNLGLSYGVLLALYGFAYLFLSRSAQEGQPAEWGNSERAPGK